MTNIAVAPVLAFRLGDPRQNGLGLMRLVLAMLVLISHGFAAGGYGHTRWRHLAAAP